MFDAAASWNGPILLRGLVLALVAWPTAAAPPKRAAKIQAPAEIPLEARVAALQALHPGLSQEAARLKAARLEEAWKRAQAKGLLKGQDWQDARMEGRREVLGKAYLAARPGHPGMTDEQIFAAFMGQAEERRVSHVLCKTQAEAETALKRIQGGEAFDRVAAELSKDPSAAVNQGQLGWIREKQMVAAFGKPVFAAEAGALVGPIQSEFGWHVVKVWEARRPKAEDFPAQRPILLKEAAAAESAMKRDAAMGPLRERYPLTPDMTVLGADRTTEPLPGDDTRVAGCVAGATISLKALKAHLAEVLKTMGQSHSLGAATKGRFMEGLADKIRLAAAAQKQGLDRKPQVRAALWVDEREQAYARYAEAYLAGFKVAEADLQKHHQAHPDRFRQVGSLRVQVLVTDSKDQVDEALNQIRMGMTWREAVAKFANAEATGNPEPGWVEVSSLKAMVPPTLLRPLLTGPAGQVVGPMLAPDGFMILNALERRPGPVLAFSECQDAVRADYLREQGAALVEQALDQPAGRP